MLSRTYLNSLRQQHGFTLVEIMLAIVIIGITAFGVANLFSNVFRPVTIIQDSNSCRNNVNAVINRIRSMGLRTELIQYTDYLDGTPASEMIFDHAGGAGEAAATDAEPGVQPDHRFPSTDPAFRLMEIPGPTAPVLLRTPHLIKGAIGGFTAIYNSDENGFCNGFQTYNFTANFDVTPDGAETENIIGKQTTFNIRLYDINTGDVIACGAANTTDIIVAPPVTGGSFDPNVVEYGANVRPDVGLLITIRTQYDSAGGDPGNAADDKYCTGQIRLQYPPDTAPPTGVPLSAQIITNDTFFPAADTGIGPAPNNCPADPNANEFTVRVGYIGNAYTEAPIWMCRDMSIGSRPPDATAFAQCTSNGTTALWSIYKPGSSQATGGTPGYDFKRAFWNVAEPVLAQSAAGPTWAEIHQEFNQRAGQANVFGHNAFPAGKVDAGLNEDDTDFVPCASLTICGVGPASSTVSVVDASNYYVDMTYNNLPHGCVVQFEAAAMDASGNLAVPGDRLQFAPSAALDAGSLDPDQMYLIHIPRCGVYCGYDATRPHGYYSCDGTCP